MVCRLNADLFFNEGYDSLYADTAAYKQEVIEKSRSSSFESPSESHPSDELEAFWGELSKSRYFGAITLYWGDFSRLKYRFFMLPAGESLTWTHDLFEPYPIKSMMFFGEGLISFGKRKIDTFGFANQLTHVFAHTEVSDTLVVSVCNTVPTFCYSIQARTDLYVSAVFMGWMENQRKGNII